MNGKPLADMTVEEMRALAGSLAPDPDVAVLTDEQIAEFRKRCPLGCAQATQPDVAALIARLRERGAFYNAGETLLLLNEAADALQSQAEDIDTIYASYNDAVAQIHTAEARVAELERELHIAKVDRNTYDSAHKTQAAATLRAEARVTELERIRVEKSETIRLLQREVADREAERDALGADAAELRRIAAFYIKCYAYDAASKLTEGGT